MTGPLDGIRVLEIAEAVAGPYAAMALGDAGAEVTKVESPDGDRTRDWGSHTRGDHGAVYLALNRNKRSITLDPAQAASKEAIQKLVAAADVIVVDAGWDDRYGLRYEQLHAANPRAVYVVVSQWGPSGPWAHQQPYGELSAQLASEATMSLGVLGEAPVRMGTDIGGMYAGVYAVQAIGAALLSRERSGQGQRIDVSLFGALLQMRSTLWVALSNPDYWWGFHLDSYVKPPELGYTCADGRIYFSLVRMTEAERDQMYQELDMDWVRTVDRAEMFQADRGGLGTRWGYLITDIWDQAFAKHPRAKVIECIRRLGGWAFPKYDYEQLANDEQVAAVGMIRTMHQPGRGDIRVMEPPWEFAETPASIRRPAPLLGEHTAEILAEIGVAAG